MTSPAMLDRGSVAAQADERVDWRHKGMAPAFWGLTVDELRVRRPRLSQLPTPLLTLSRPALDHNRDTFAQWCAERRFTARRRYAVESAGKTRWRKKNITG